MKGTLSPISLDSLLGSWESMKSAVAASVSEESAFPLNIFGLKGSLPSFFIKNILKKKDLKSLSESQYSGKTSNKKEDLYIIVSGQKEAEELLSDLETVLGDEQIFILPSWESIPYRPSSLNSSSFGKRARVLSAMSWKNTGKKQRIFIITQRAFLTPLPPPEYIKSLTVSLKKGQTFDPEKMAEKLTELGYLRVPKVGMRGEFALRGEVLDFFMPGEENPDRIVFDFDQVEQIKTFEAESQSSLTNLDQIVIYPNKEILWTSELVEKLRSVFENAEKSGIENDFASYDRKRMESSLNENSFSNSSKSENEGAEEEIESIEKKSFNLEEKTGKDKKEIHLSFTDEAKKAMEKLLLELETQKESSGEELFYGFLWDSFYSVMDYIPSESLVLVFDADRLENGQKMIRNEYDITYRQSRLNFPVFPPSKMLLDYQEILCCHNKRILLRSLETSKDLCEENTSTFIFNAEVTTGYYGNINYLKEQLTNLLQDKWNVFIFADNPSQALRIKEVLKEFSDENKDEKNPLSIVPKAISQGFSVPSEKILVIQENEIFGRKKKIAKSLRKGLVSKPIDSFVDLTPGDYVVHVNYGIGLFKGIERVKTSITERDYIKLQYADEEVAFIPIEQVNMVQRYIGSESEKPKLDRIGSKSWSSRKAKVQEKVEEMANKLIDLYSKRNASRGYAFPKDGEWQAAFEAAFPYEDTPDQYQATEDIKADMERPIPMDRLVCGDVGYGKTEIAMRAAFKAVMGGKQVAFLAPTTILAEQHYENCLERFKNFPVTIAQLSRFVSPSKQKEILKQLGEGKIDIVIGTHRIIQKDVVFKDLGLMIIDEEQRFGVKDKEKLKSIKTNIDSLAMSATPIPRTLHMSLLKIRDMSLLTTPPHNRQPIETVIDEYDSEKVAEAIRREVERGGQVFYLHNRVETLNETRIKLQNLCPELLIDVAHGQMTSDELDDIFRRFKMGGFHVLVATTIIENGIDIPNVNTIIIDRADMYGVSQLYQLRGRVGRSDRKAYAYLYYPENKVLNELAMKRLQAISDFTELGSGFKIAMKDMEIRGAGNLLGKDQSGEVYAVGFEMYVQLLNNAIERLVNSDWHAPEETLLELDYTGFIPENYIKLPQIKMEMYKKIASIHSDEELSMVTSELEDRFGPIPDEVLSLLSLAKIRIICCKLSINSLKEKGGLIRIEFGKVNKVSVDKVLNLISLEKGKVRLDPLKPNVLTMNLGKIDLVSKADFIKSRLEMLV